MTVLAWFLPIEVINQLSMKVTYTVREFPTEFLTLSADGNGLMRLINAALR